MFCFLLAFLTGFNYILGMLSNDNSVLAYSQQQKNQVFRMNDTFQVPPWPMPHDKEIVFLLPKTLNSIQKIEVSGNLRDSRKLFGIKLITGNNSADHRNIACQFQAKFPEGNDDLIEIKLIRNGAVEVVHGDHEGVKATDIFTDLNFTLELTLRIHNNDITVVDLYAEGSFIQQFQIKHYLSDTLFLALDGDIEKVNKFDFEFRNK